jgi:hypothetical protein
MPLAYQAAMALGRIYEGKGSDRGMVRDINAALLAAMHSDWPPEAYRAPAAALVMINGIDLGPRARPGAMPAENLAEAVDKWFDANQAALPPLAQRPWQLNLRMLHTTSDANQRSQAAQAVAQAKTLEPIEPILELLTRESGLADPVRTALTGLLRDMTGLAYPPPPGQPEDPVERWRVAWFSRLKTSTDPAHVAYSWRGLERCLRRFRAMQEEEQPDDEQLEAVVARLKELRAVLVHQLANEAAIPGGASPDVRDLLIDPLVSKENIRLALDHFRKATRRIESERALLYIQRELEEGPASETELQIGNLYLQTIVNLAHAEADRAFAVKLGVLLTFITKVPCDLDQPTQPARRKALATWVGKVRARQFQVNAPQA